MQHRHCQHWPAASSPHAPTSSQFLAFLQNWLQPLGQPVPAAARRRHEAASRAGAQGRGGGGGRHCQLGEEQKWKAARWSSEQTPSAVHCFSPGELARGPRGDATRRRCCLPTPASTSGAGLPSCVVHPMHTHGMHRAAAISHVQCIPYTRHAPAGNYSAAAQHTSPWRWHWWPSLAPHLLVRQAFFNCGLAHVLHTPHLGVRVRRVLRIRLPPPPAPPPPAGRGQRASGQKTGNVVRAG